MKTTINLHELRASAFKIAVDLNLSAPGITVWDSSQYQFAVRSILTQDAYVQSQIQSAVLASVYTEVEESVLIYGPTGCGKELFAKIFAQDVPFVAINCTSLPDYLVESELFGHVRGAFTSAINDREGLFQVAGKGVLFIDEIGDMPVTMQPKLLRVLQERVIRRVGDNKDIPIQCRVVVATHRDLNLMVASGEFREDLFWRISTHRLEITPLRKRIEDAHLYLRTHGSDVYDEVIPLLNGTLSGNYRELQQYILRERLRKKLLQAGTPPAT